MFNRVLGTPSVQTLWKVFKSFLNLEKQLELENIFCRVFIHHHSCIFVNSNNTMLLNSCPQVFFVSTFNFKSFNAFKVVIFDFEVRIDFNTFYDYIKSCCFWTSSRSFCWFIMLNVQIFVEVNALDVRTKNILV